MTCLTYKQHLKFEKKYRSFVRQRFKEKNKYYFIAYFCITINKYSFVERNQVSRCLRGISDIIYVRSN